MSEVKTARVTKVVEIKPWNGQRGTVFYCRCEMDNGDKIEIGKKKEVQEGWELTYTIEDTNQEYNKAKAAQKPEQAPSAYRGSLTNDNRTDAILYQTCLKAATEALTTMYDPQWEQSKITAQSINSFALELAQGAKANIEKL